MIIKNFYNKFKEWLNESPINWLIIVLSFFTLIFFLIQHYFILSWDFSAYVLNAKYLFYGGSYFEVYRAPMASLLLGVFLLVGKFGEYLYILFTSCLFFISTYWLGNTLYDEYFSKYKINRLIVLFLFFFFSLNIFLLNRGLLVGTELLGLAFFQIFLVYFIKNKISGYWFGLAFLSRYNFLVFLPLLFFNKGYKKILKNIASFFLTIFPWLLFNFLKFGNWFASIVDSYYLNIFSRKEMVEPFLASSLLPLFNWFAPFFILGLIFFIYRFYKNRGKKFIKFFSEIKFEILFLVIFLVIIFDFWKTPFKITRYLFNLVLPIAFFSVLGMVLIFRAKFIKRNKEKFFVPLTIVFVVIASVNLYGYYEDRNIGDVYGEAAKDIKDLGIGNCTVVSPHWVPVNYYSENVGFLSGGIRNAINREEIVLIFKNRKTRDNVYSRVNIDNFNTLYETESYVFVVSEGFNKKECREWRGHDSPLVRNHCFVISQALEKIDYGEIVLKTCKLINFKY